MSPEANQPNTQTGSDRFQEGLHPTDGVRPFKQGDLPDVHDRLLERGVPEVSPIDPQTLEVTVDKVPLSPAETKKKSKALKIGGAIGAVILAGGAALGIGAMGNDTPERATTSASPDADPSAPTGETAPTDDATAEVSDTPEVVTPESLIGKPSTEFDTLNVAAPEALRTNVEPVTVAEYATPEAAAEQFGKLMNLRDLGGVIDYPNTGINETPESLELRDKLDRVIFEPSLLVSGEVPNFQDENDTRRLIAGEFYAINDMKMYPTDEIPTFHTEWLIGDVQQTNMNEYTVDYREKSYTNMFDIDNTLESHFHISPEGVEGTMTVVQEGDVWYVRQLESNQ